MQTFKPPSQEEYQRSNAWGLVTCVDLHDCAHEPMRSAEAIKEFTAELCRRLEVKAFGETQVVMFGDDPRVHGYSMTQLIETSLLSGHFAEDTNAVYLDIFSCKYYDPQVMVGYAAEFFGAKRFNAHTVLRGCDGMSCDAAATQYRERQILLQAR